MNFDLDDEQRLLKDSAEKLAAATGALAEPTAEAADPWPRLAELGLLGLPFAEDDGGFGAGPIETMIVAEALGRGLNLAPYVASIVLAGGLLRLAGTPEQRGARIPGIADGTARLAFAHQEPGMRYDIDAVAMSARRDGEGWVLDGRKVAVAGGDRATAFIVSARTLGRAFERNGISLFLVDAAAPGVARTVYAMHDGSSGADLGFDDVRVPASCVLRADGGGYTTIERAVDAALAATFAESVGLMEAMLALTVQHLRTRMQFGRRLGDFQALQHRAAEMLVAMEQARSMTMLATSVAGSTDDAERRGTISAARVQVAESLRFVGQQAVQLHGGLGITEEHAIGRCFRRATALESAFGDADHHLALFAETGGFLDPYDLGAAGTDADALRGAA